VLQTSKAYGFRLPERSLNLGVMVALFFVFSLLGACSEQQEAPPPLELPVVEVLQRDQPIEMEMVGQTRGSSDIPIRARVDPRLVGYPDSRTGGRFSGEHGFC